MANGDSCGAGGRKQYQFKRSGTVVDPLDCAALEFMIVVSRM